MLTRLRPKARIRKDILLLIISLAALSGGILVYRSFAGNQASLSQPDNTGQSKLLH